MLTKEQIQAYVAILGGSSDELENKALSELMGHVAECLGEIAFAATELLQYKQNEH